MEYVDVEGSDIPKLGLGTWQNTGTTCVDAVKTALDVGYRHVDTAQVYGNEREVGEGIATSTVAREEVFVTTKIHRRNLRHDDVLESVRESLDRLGTTYIDLLLMHWHHPRVPVEETLDAMASLQDDGIVRHLGVIDLLLRLKGQESPTGLFRLRVSSAMRYAFASRVGGRRPVTTPDVLSSAYSRVNAAFLPGHAGRLRQRRWSIQSTRPHGSRHPKCYAVHSSPSR